MGSESKMSITKDLLVSALYSEASLIWPPSGPTMSGLIKEVVLLL